MKRITPDQALRGGSEFARILLASGTKKGFEFQKIVENPKRMERAMSVAVDSFFSTARGENVNGGLSISPDDGTIILAAEIDRDQTDEELVAEARKAGWRVDDLIRTDRRIDFQGRTKRSGIEEVTLEVPKTIPDGEVWATKKVLYSIGEPGLVFDLADLVKFIQHRDELLKAGVRFIIAFGARFRDGSGDECVAYLNLENRNVNLYNFENDWNDNDRFGRSCNCLHFIY